MTTFGFRALVALTACTADRHRFRRECAIQPTNHSVFHPHDAAKAIFDSVREELGFPINSDQGGKEEMLRAATNAIWTKQGKPPIPEAPSKPTDLRVLRKTVIRDLVEATLTIAFNVEVSMQDAVNAVPMRNASGKTLERSPLAVVARGQKTQTEPEKERYNWAAGTMAVGQVLKGGVCNTFGAICFLHALDYEFEGVRYVANHNHNWAEYQVGGEWYIIDPWNYMEFEQMESGKTVTEVHLQVSTAEFSKVKKRLRLLIPELRAKAKQTLKSVLSGEGKRTAEALACATKFAPDEDWVFKWADKEWQWGCKPTTGVTKVEAKYINRIKSLEEHQEEQQHKKKVREPVRLEFKF